MDFLVNFVTWFKGLPGGAKVSLFLVLVGVVTAGILLQSQVRTAGYQYLYTNLSMTDMNSIAERLQAMNVQPEIRGDSVLVPGNRVLELRNLLASEGLPRGGGTGFEIFDEKNFGATDFEKRVNYLRAIQGELARTISAIDGVSSARVHIVMPEKTLFAKDQKNPTSSVALTLHKGRRLSDSQIAGIVHLVITSVEGLTQENINVIDQNGNMLFRASGEEGVSASGRQMELQGAAEKQMSSRISDILEKVVGPGRFSVSVSADMDFSQIEKTVEQFDPEGRVAISESAVTEKSSGSSGAGGGAPGAASNLPGGAASGSSQRSENSNRSETTNTFAVSKTVQRIVEPVGEIKKISVAVVVDGNYTKAEDGTSTYAPRSAEEIAKLSELVQKAIGFNSARGDEVRVENIQFKSLEDRDVAQEAFIEATNSSRWTLFLMDNATVIGIILIAGIIFFLLVRLVNSYAPPMEVAYANIIGERAGAIASSLPSGGAIQIVQRDSPDVQAKAELLAAKNPDLSLAKQAEEKLAQAQAALAEQTITSDEKLRLQAAKMQVEKLIQGGTDEAVQVVRAWLNED